MFVITVLRGPYAGPGVYVHSAEEADREFGPDGWDRSSIVPAPQTYAVHVDTEDGPDEWGRGYSEIEARDQVAFLGGQGRSATAVEEPATLPQDAAY